MLWRLLFIAVLLAGLSGQAVAQDEVKGWLYIPSINMVEPLYKSLIIDEVYQIPEHDAVWLTGTAWLDTTYADLLASGGSPVPEGAGYPAGRVVLSGHRADVFSSLPGLQVGDIVYLAEWPLLVEFEIVTIKTVEFDPDLLAPTTEDQRLVLITCDGDQRLVIEAIRR
jgi:LPXTG-site transpeptidase (sortase) family protein